jgi:ribose transport system ATP-binding protein
MVDWRAIAKDVKPIADRVGVKAALGASAKGLSAAENWLVNITRALVRKSRLIVMDEPTAALSAVESERLFAIVRALHKSGVAVLYVSHRLDEILDLCQCVTVFRDGRSVSELAGPTLTRSSLVEAIVGGAIEAEPKRAISVASRPIILSARALRRAPKVIDANFDLHAGEVLGLGGLVGAGRTELARLVFGADRADAGAMLLAGQPYAPRNPAEAVRAGIGFVPEERRTEGLILRKSVAFNLSLANLGSLIVSPALPFISGSRRRSLAERVIRELAVKTASVETAVGQLSGGNQQKVLIGRWLQSKPKALILDEPTRGVDVGARGEIHRLIRGLAQAGAAVMVVSSEPDELPDLCDRVLVMVEGRIVAELSGATLNRQGIVAASYAAAHERNRS